ncbi:MAG: DUF4430 domain-containing protein [Lachnospiraceae bacterium]|nr:DUF4430 domain-containing protein [Lachnospiraceae bacterium]
MKEKRIRRILVVAILVIAAVSIIIKFNIKAPEKANAPAEIVAEANSDTEETGKDTEDEPSDDSKDEPSGDSTDDSDENNDNGGDNDSNTGNDNENDDDDADEPSGDDDTDNEDPINYITVYITIDATLLADGDVLRANNRENKIEYTGDNGIIASRAVVKVPENASVYDALHTFCLENDIQMEASGTSFGTAYIRGINHLYEFDGGISSGWVFLVNRVYATSGASNVHLKEGDEVWWFYTLAFGKDVPGK